MATIVDYLTNHRVEVIGIKFKGEKLIVKNMQYDNAKELEVSRGLYDRLQDVGAVTPELVANLRELEEGRKIAFIWS